MPSSIDMSRWIRSFLGTNSRKPEVGLGVVGTNTLTSSSSARAWISPRVGPVTKPIAPMPRRGYSIRTTSRNERDALREHGLEDLLERAVDAAHDRHAREQPLAQAHQGAAGEAGGQHADQGQEGQHHQQAETRQAERQIGLGIVARRDQAADLRVEEGHELPDQEDRDADRRGDDDAGQEVGAQAGEQARRLAAARPRESPAGPRTAPSSCSAGPRPGDIAMIPCDRPAAASRRRDAPQAMPASGPIGSGPMLRPAATAAGRAVDRSIARCGPSADHAVSP